MTAYVWRDFKKLPGVNLDQPSTQRQTNEHRGNDQKRSVKWINAWAQTAWGTLDRASIRQYFTLQWVRNEKNKKEARKGQRRKVES